MRPSSKWIVLGSVIEGVWALPHGPSTISNNDRLVIQGALPPKQDWCPSEIFCAGPLLHNVELAHIYPDSKTFVDKPTVYSSQVTVANFNALGQSPTVGAISQYVQTNFKSEGQELKPLAVNITETPTFLKKSDIQNRLVRSWTGVVHTYWKDLIRNTDQSTLCARGLNSAASCESSLIPLNHTFVVPGGRFREQYYWDSFWILEGLLKSELYDIARSTLENFMDEIANFGFIPNGGRVYYLNRSQPPVFVHMLSRYVDATKDYNILRRAIPLADAEIAWWTKNRAVQVVSPYTKTSHTIYRYSVTNSAPRPESYAEDYETANGNDLITPYTEKEKADLYAELASGAESGWDYSSRWSREPWSNRHNLTNLQPLMRTLNVRGIGAVDLNSILYKAMLSLADLHELNEQRNQENSSKAMPSTYRKDATKLRSAIIDLMWDSSKLSFYDFNITSNSRSGFYSAAAFYPMWNDIWPDEVLADEQKAMGMFASVGLVLSMYNGTYPSTFMTTGMQWDAPNTWPPHQYIIIQALSKVPSSVSTRPYPQLSSGVTSLSLVPPNQLGLDRSQLPAQIDYLTRNPSSGGDINYLNGTWTDAGFHKPGETWNQALRRGVINRYFTSVFCSWYSTGGSIPRVLAQLPPDQLLKAHSDPSSTGHMYEKLNLLDIGASGSGGEYTVQAGFGWTNGVILWAAAEFGHLIVEPKCPGFQVRVTSSGVKGYKGPGELTWLFILATLLYSALWIL
ncbi:hypothetical protein FRC03_011247 [Tulasnella sp. 419]|nr:hypothetical protein FRC03_011247 [Tulasnella sp. 419]